MRKAALIAGAVQLLYATFIVAPQIFGAGFLSTASQLTFRILDALASLVLSAFLFAIAKTPKPNIGGPVGVLSLAAAMALIIENFQSAYGTIRFAATEAFDSYLWKYHFLKRFASVLGNIAFTLAEITLILFFLCLFATSLKVRKGESDANGSKSFLRYVSFTAAAVSSIFLIGMLLTLHSTPWPIPVSGVRILLRFVTLASFISFFLVFGLRQRSTDVNEERLVNPSMT
ncbi:MAG TPA: hypothetical protein VL986_11950 [Terracidiphilus sp.]|nr:hypothetical protein [Terracidiphilus sp.]